MSALKIRFEFFNIVFTLASSTRSYFNMRVERYLARISTSSVCLKLYYYRTECTSPIPRPFCHQIQPPSPQYRQYTYFAYTIRCICNSTLVRSRTNSHPSNLFEEKKTVEGTRPRGVEAWCAYLQLDPSVRSLE